MGNSSTVLVLVHFLYNGYVWEGEHPPPPPRRHPPLPKPIRIMLPSSNIEERRHTSGATAWAARSGNEHRTAIFNGYVRRDPHTCLDHEISPTAAGLDALLFTGLLCRLISQKVLNQEPREKDGRFSRYGKEVVQESSICYLNKIISKLHLKWRRADSPLEDWERVNGGGRRLGRWVEVEDGWVGDWSGKMIGWVTRGGRWLGRGEEVEDD